MFGGLSVSPPIPTIGPTGSFPDPNYFNNPQSVKQDLDITRDLTIGGEVVGDVTITGKTTTNSFENETLATFQQGARFNESGSTGTNKDLVLTPPGIYYGNGSGLTNLPIANFNAPDFSFQSTLLDFSVAVDRWNYPEIPTIAPTVSIPCELAGQPPGLYYWRTSSTILVQQIWDSAGGVILWDGVKVSGESTWNLVQALGFYNPIYTLIYSSLFDLETTGFYVTTETTTTAVDPLQPGDYFVDFYRLGTFGPPPSPP